MTLQLKPGQEVAYERVVEFAVELLDAVTLERVSAGVKVTAEGLRGKPIVNASGLFVWLREDRTALQKLVIEPQRRLPYEKREIEAAEVDPRFTRILLWPRIDYPFPSGLTALRGTLIERPPPNPHEPVAGAKVSLRWLDDNGVTWRDSPIESRTNPDGDFSTALRLSPADAPLVQNREVTVRLRVQRPGLADRESADLNLPQGHTAEPATPPSALTFAWDDLHL